MDRDDPYADLGGSTPGTAYVPPRPSVEAAKGFAQEGERLLVDWFRNGAQQHPREVMDSIIQLFRAHGWREPPVGKSPMSEEWRRRSNYRLPPGRVQENAQRARDQLHAAKRVDAGPAPAVGSDAGGNGAPEE